MPKITLSMIVKNEEQYLRECLESVKGIVDEIVIVDTGSTDKTIEIAKEFNAKIFHFEWIKDFSATRNFALSKSTGDWILYLDADERLERKSKKELLKKIKSNDRLGINCVINNLDDYKKSPKLMKYIRLFKNDKNISFIGKAHEQIEPSLLKNNYKVIDSSIEITHLGYNVPEEKLKEKAERNLEMLLADYKQNQTSYGAFQIANSYSIIDDTENTIAYFKKALLDKNLRKEFKSVCYIHIADYEMREGNLQTAKELVDKGVTQDRNHTLLNMVASQVYYQLNENKKAINFCKNAFKQNEITKRNKKSNNVIDILVEDKKIIYHGVLLSLVSNNIDSIKFFLNKLGDISKKEQTLFVKLLQNNNLNDNDLSNLIELINENSLDLVLKLLENNSDAEFKLDFYSKIYDKFSNSSKYLISFGTFLISINQLNEAEVIFKLSIDNNENNYSGIFYLASVYVQKEKYLELNELLNIAEEKIKPNSPHYSKLQILKEKVRPLVEIIST